MKIGLYFGSFNPVHIGHLIIANHILNEGLVDKVWFIVSPQNPFKVSSTLLNEYQRLHLLRLATEADERMKVSDIEFSLPKPSYTSTTLAHLVEKYSERAFALIMGGDSFQNINKWKNSEYITTNFPILVYNRPGFEIEKPPANVKVLDAPLLQISATTVRTLVREGKSIRYLVPEPVETEIIQSGYYRK